MVEPAVRLAGAYAAHNQALGVSQPPVYRARDERVLELVHSALHDPDRREAAWQEGHAMSLDHAVAYAIDTLS
jgi:hypothetical protein